jgi:hypothetical protein
MIYAPIRHQNWVIPGFILDDNEYDVVLVNSVERLGHKTRDFILAKRAGTSIDICPPFCAANVET